MAILALHKVQKSFDSHQVLTDVTFSVATGEILGLFGRNGSGKSTMLKILFGTQKADVLAYSINNKAIKSSQVIKNKSIGYLPQHSILPKQIKVRDVIPVFHSTEATQDVIFYDPHIATMTHKKVGDLSLGELKYLEVLLLAYLPHPFLLLDEPFSMLEPLHKEQLKKIIKTLQKTKGIIITDHYYEDVLEITTKNIVLTKGIAYTVQTKKDLKAFDYLK